MKPLKLGNNGISDFDRLAKRLVEAERKATISKTKREETDSEIEARFAKLREARAKERFGPAPGGPLTYGDVDDGIIDEEIEFHMKRALRPTPEQRYQNIKRVGYARGHEDACNNSLGKCVPTCRFFPDEGRIEDDEVIAKYQDWKRERDSTTREEKREARQRLHYYMLVYDDDTDEQRKQRYLQHQKYIQEHPLPWF